jgi:hypothetical protein
LSPQLLSLKSKNRSLLAFSLEDDLVFAFSLPPHRHLKHFFQPRVGLHPLIQSDAFPDFLLLGAIRRLLHRKDSFEQHRPQIGTIADSFGFIVVALLEQARRRFFAF